MQKPKSVTAVQLTMSIGTSIIGVGILAFPRITVEYVRTGAPFAAAFAMLLMMCGGIVVAYLGKQYPNQTIFEYADGLVGKWLGKLMTVVIGCYFLELAALASREFGEVVVTSVLQRTPISVTVFVMILLATIACRSDVAVFSRILTFYMPFVYFPALIIVVLSLKSAQLTNLMPILGLFHGQPLSNITESIMVVASLFTNYLIVGLLVPFMYRPGKAIKSTLVGMGIAGMLYIILMFATLSVFGIEEMNNLLWPTLELAKTAALPTFFVERLDPVFLAVWVTAVFSAIFAAYYLAIQAFGHLFELKSHRSLSLLAMPVILALAKQPADIVMLYQVVQQVGIIGLCLTLGYPLILLIVHVSKTARVKS
ncbi:GerAB/ArcD/ProY family transporter [Alicyclobacillus dauci]|uniref:Spore germination protein n=1 Tax=Alicyclobacillus dauci TaxID=1475485 RepID=A0ABY6Z877_9BACL|nr:GerAB/ArcD/ProY family transporter [Alicyclobacillus dauci]WAH38733.1 spore germination protein [Alicyclobacillus dauci]